MIDIDLTPENVREVMARKDLDQCRIHIRGDTRGLLPQLLIAPTIGEMVIHERDDDGNPTLVGSKLMSGLSSKATSVVHEGWVPPKRDALGRITTRKTA